MLTLVFITALNNGYSSPVFSLSVSWQRLLTQHYTADIPVLQHTHKVFKSQAKSSQADEQFLSWPSPTKNCPSESKSELLYDWRFTTNQFVLASSTLRPTTRDFFSNWAFAVYSLRNILSDEMGFVCYEYVWPFVKCTFRTYSMLFKHFLLLHYAQILCQYRLCRIDHAYLTHLILQLLSSHLNGRKLDHRQFSASCIFYVWLHLLLYREHDHSHDSLWLRLISCTILLCNHIHTDG
jgi:hypothetical protein